MQTAWNHWRDDIARRLSDQLGVVISSSEMVTPPDPALGDFAFGCFQLAKAQKKNPAELAKTIAASFEKDGSDIEAVTAAGPYVNFTLAPGAVTHRVITDVEEAEEEYGHTELGASQGTILFEYANPNTHKEFHIGHLRNFVLGVSLSRILRVAGFSVHPVSYINDVGSNVGKCLWQLVRAYGFLPETFDEKQLQELLRTVPKEQQTASSLGKIYTDAVTHLEANEELKPQISTIQKKLEAHDEVWETLWRETRQWCLDEFKKIFDELEVEIEKQYFESTGIDRSHKIVDELIEKGIAKQSQGAVIVDLEDEKLGVAVLRKTDGTLLYFTKDFALAEEKIKDYPDLRRSVMLTDMRQRHYFQQLAAVLRRMDVKASFEFVGYELVVLPEGAMSSRKGNIITYQSFREAVFEYALREVETRHEDWSAEKKSAVAWDIATSGMKFGMLKQDNDKVYTFDMKQALSFDGATGPYCQYAATRLASILRKANTEPKEEEPLTKEFEHASEKALAMRMAALPEKARLAAQTLRPSVIAQWCMEMAQTINDFYRDVPVLQSSGTLLEGRLRLTRAARIALKQGLFLLGIPVPEEM